MVPQRTVSFKFRVGLKGPRPPFFGLLNISALHVQYGIQVFAKFKRVLMNSSLQNTVVPLLRNSNDNTKC